ncbi:hypothetical protein [Streptomyces sp. NPDC001508]|uniref:hypothetical protein n=1 Tax=Streptomyces sp. NPDC001508 TaxID=3154656 RepID=UPI003320C9C4
MTTTDLARLIKDRLAALDLSYRTAAARSRGMLTPANLSAIVTGKHGGKLTERTIDGLALALGLPRADIERAAGIYRERPAEPFKLPEELNRLNRKERALLEQMGLALLAAREEGRQGAVVPEVGAVEAGAVPELSPEEIESVVIERKGKPPFAVARPRALGPMSEHERRQHIARVEQLEEEMRRGGSGRAQNAP